jgi:hypothetical protein
MVFADTKSNPEKPKEYESPQRSKTVNKFAKTYHRKPKTNHHI